MVVAKARIGWIDSARGLGIVLVVLGHIITTIRDIPVSYVIFTFHMPLFLFLTTMTMKEQRWQDALQAKTRTFLVPYVCYLALLGLPYLIYQFSQSIGEGAKFALRMVLGGTFLVETFGTFWYIPAVYVGFIAYLAMHDRFGGDRSRGFVIAMIPVIFLAYAISYMKIGFPVPYALHTLPSILALIWIGRLVPWTTRPVLLTIAALFILALAIAYDFQTPGPTFQFDLKNGRLGPPLFGILVALAGSQVVFQVARLSDRVPALAGTLGYLGRITIPILFLHQAVHFGLKSGGVGSELITCLAALAIPTLLVVLVQQLRPAAGIYLGIPAPTRKSRVTDGEPLASESSPAT